MARLRGVASEHHPEGPGDGPRRRSRKSKTTSTMVMASSSPAPSGTKRAASPSVEVPQKRAKAYETIEEVDEQSEDELASEQLAHETAARTPEPIRRPQASRRYSAPLTTLVDTEAGAQSSSQLSFKDRRRARMSMPAQLHVTDHDEIDGGRQIQFASLQQTLDRHSRLRLRRNHLSEEMNDIDAHKKKDARMRKEHAELRRQVHEYEKKIQDLQFQLESARLGNINISEDQTTQLRQQLEQAHQQIEDLQASSVYNMEDDGVGAFAGDDSDDDEDALMLVDPTELNLTEEQMRASPLPQGHYATRALQTSQVTVEELSSFAETTRDNLAESMQIDPDAVPDRISDKAIHRYKTEIEDLAHKVAESASALRVITIELQNMDIAAPGTEANDILARLRHVFENVREEYETLFGRSTVGINNAELIEKVFEELRGMNDELVQKIELTERQNQRIALVQAQYESTMGLLADAEAQNIDLKAQVVEVEAVNHEQKEELDSLEEDLRRENDNAESLAQQLAEKTATVDSMQDELEDKETSVQRLKEALSKLHTEHDTLTNTIMVLEKQSADKVSAMELAHAERVADLEERLNDETLARADAEALAAEKTEFIEDLEQRYEDLTSKADKLADDVDALTAQLEEVVAARDALQTERDTLQDVSYDQANQVENLEERIADLEKDIEQMRINLEAERTQREGTEAELDAANEKIEEQEEQIHNQGLQANELRSKLFQVQQEKEAALADKNEEIEILQEDNEEALQSEIQRRTAAEEKVDRLETQITGIQEELAATDRALQESQLALAALQADRNEKLAALNQRYEDLVQQYTALETTTQTTIDSLQATITDLTNERNTLHATVQTLEATVTEVQEKHTEDIAEREGVIKGLENELTDTLKQNAELVQKNKSLEGRIEHEALELLNIMGSHAQEIASLRAAISSHSAHITDLEAAAAKRATEHEEQLALKEVELEELRIVGAARAEMIVAMEAQIEQMKEMFEVQAADSQNTINGLMADNRQRIEKQEEMSAATNKRTVDALHAVREMSTKGLVVKSNGLDLNKVRSGKVTKVNDRVKISKKSHIGRSIKKQKYRDSGIGVDDDEEDEFVGLEASDEGVAA